MIPEVNYPEKSVSMDDLVARLRAAPVRAAAAVDGLSDAELAVHPVPGKWSIGECTEHIALVSLGWTEIFFAAIEGVYDSPRCRNARWAEPLETKAKGGVTAALEVFARHHDWLASYLGALPAADWGRPFKVVAFLTEPFLIRESINWGCVIHCDWHLAQIAVRRRLLGKPLPWLSVYPERYPRAVAAMSGP